MTVKALIEKLKKVQNQDSDVYTYHCKDCTGNSVDVVKTERAGFNADEHWVTLS